MILEELKNRNKFTTTEYELVKFVLNSSQDVIHMNQEELAQAAYVSPSAISRFVQKVGCRNYGDFKIRLAKELEAVNGKIVDYNRPFEAGASIKEIAEGIYSSDVGGLKACLDQLDEKMIRAVVKELLSCKRIDLFGAGSTISTAAFFAEYMARIGYRTQIHDNSARMYLTVEEGDFKIIISHSGKPRPLIELAQHLKKQDARILLITGNPASPMIQYADYCLFTSSDEDLAVTNKIGLFSSRISISFILSILYSCVFNENYDKNMKKLEETGQLQTKEF